MPRLFALLAVLVAAPAASAQFVWNTTTGTWNTPANWVGNAVPPSADTTQLLFNNAGAGYTTTNNIGPFTLNRLTVNNTGTGPVTVAASAAANRLAFAGATPTLDVQAGTAVVTAVLDGAPDLVKAGAGTAIQRSNSNVFTGTVTIDGGTFVVGALSSGTFNFNPTAIVVNNGGTFQFGENLVGDPNLPNATYITVNAGGTVDWQEGEVFGGFNLQGGTINLRQGGATSNGGTAQEWTSGAVTGGAFATGGSAVINKTTAGTVTVGGGVTLSSGLNLEAGTVAYLTPANVGGTAGVGLGDGGSSTGVFSYRGAGDATRGGADGSFAVNPGGGVVEVTNPLSTLTITPAVSGNGPLTKAGPGFLALAALPTNTGLTTVAAGTLRVAPGTAAGGFAVSGGAVLAVDAGAGAATVGLPSLALAGTDPTLLFELDAAGLPTTPLLSVTGANALTGGGVLRLTNQQPFAPGVYPLVSYTGTAIAAGFTLQLPGRTAGSLVYNTAASRLDASITGTDTVRWGGQAGNVWDVGTAAGVGGTFNFRLQSSGASTNFIQTDTVAFTDAGLNPMIDIAAAVAPAAVTVDNGSVMYTFGGAGKVTGPTGLAKLGTGALVLATDNDYTGGTTVGGGLLQLGGGGTTGSVVGGISLAENTTLAFNRSAAATVINPVTSAASFGLVQNGTGPITLTSALTFGAGTLSVSGPGDLLLGGPLTGTGSLTKTGAGTLTLLANNNPFTGTVNVSAGTLILDDRGAGGDLGALSINVAGGATFQFGNADQVGNPDLPGTTLVTVSAGGTAEWNIGEDFGGLVLDGGALNMRGGVNFASETSVNELRAGTITALAGTPAIGGSVPTNKTTAGTVTVTGVAIGTAGTGGNNNSALNLQAGVLASDAGFGGTGAITFGTASTAATLRLTNAVTTAVTTIARPLVVNAGGGTIEVATAGKTVAFTGSVTGTGLLTKAGAGVLAASGTTAGPLTVAAGGLRPGTALAAPTLGLGGDLTFAAGSALRVNLFGTGATDNGRVNVTGTASIPAGALLQLDASALSAGDVATVRAAGPRVYTVLQAATVTANFGGLDVAGSSFGLFDPSEFSLVASPAANTVQIQFTPVPEPGLLLAVAAVGVVGWRRRDLRVSPKR